MGREWKFRIKKHSWPSFLLPDIRGRRSVSSDLQREDNPAGCHNIEEPVLRSVDEYVISTLMITDRRNPYCQSMSIVLDRPRPQTAP